MLDRNDKDVWDLEICRQIDLLKQAGQIILYGAGAKGKEIWECLFDAHIKVDFFCDIDAEKWGKQIFGTKVLSPFEMDGLELETDKAIYIVACIPAPKELRILLEHVGLGYMRMLTYWGVKTALRVNLDDVYRRDSKRAMLQHIADRQQQNDCVNWELECIRQIAGVSSDAVWILQPGKTASSSLEARFRKSRIPFIRGHYLEYLPVVMGETFRETWERQFRSRNKPLKIITAVREPLARDYSAFWQAYTQGGEYAMLMPILTNDFQRMYDRFLECILHGSDYTKELLGLSMPHIWREEFQWFDEQLKKYLDIDVYQHPFDRERGYTIIKKDSVELFLFKVERMDKVLDEISAFVGTDNLPAVDENRADEKWYSLAYAQFQKEVRLPGEYVDHYYKGNGKVDHFYTQEEKVKFLNKWRNNIDG